MFARMKKEGSAIKIITGKLVGNTVYCQEDVKYLEI